VVVVVASHYFADLFFHPQIIRTCTDVSAINWLVIQRQYIQLWKEATKFPSSRGRRYTFPLWEFLITWFTK
jgi:hypothetical protein